MTGVSRQPGAAGETLTEVRAAMGMRYPGLFGVLALLALLALFLTGLGVFPFPF